jgi:hypothetical protein
MISMAIPAFPITDARAVASDAEQRLTFQLALAASNLFNAK